MDPELEAEAQVLFGLWSAVARVESSETPEFAAAHQELISRMENPATIFPSFALVLSASTSGDITIRRHAILSISLIIRSGPEYRPDQIQWIRARFVEAILRETNSLCQINLCEAAVDFALRTPEWPELLGLPPVLLQSDATLACGLALWHLLILSGGGDPEARELVDITPFALDLVRTALTCFESPMREVRIHALVLLDDLVWRSGDWASVHDEVVDAVLQLFHNSVYVHADPQECHAIAVQLSDVVSGAWPDDPDRGRFIDEADRNRLIQKAVEIVGATELPSDIRLAGCLVLDDGTGNCEGAATLFLEDTLEDIEGYLQIFMQLSMAIIREDPTDGRFEFLARLFHIAGEMLSGEPMFDFVWRTVTEVAHPDDPVGCQWGMFLLTTIVESQPESFGKRITEIAPFLLEAGAAPNEEIMTHAGKLISALAELCKDAINVVADDFCTFLLDRISEGANVPDLFSALEQLLEAVDTPPSGFATIKDTLLQLIGRGDQPQTFIVSIAHLLAKLPQPQEAINAEVAPLVTRLLDSELRAYGLRLLSSLVVAAPAAVKKALGTYFPVVTESLAVENWRIRSEAARCLRRFAGYYAQSLIPHANDVIQAVLAALPDTDFPMMEDDVETDEFCCFQEALFCVACFICYFPEQAAPCVDLFFDAVCARGQFERQKEAEDKPVCTYCSALTFAMPGLKALNRTECVEIAKQFMPWLIAGDHRLNWVISIHQAVAALLTHFGRDVAADERVAQEIFRHLERGIAGRYIPQYMCHDWAACIDIRLLQPMFFALTRFMSLIDWATFDSELVEALNRNLDDPRETFRAYPTEIFARIAFMTHECTEFYTKAFKLACIGLSSTCLPLQIASLNSLRFLLQTDKARFEDHRAELFNFIAEFMRLFGDGSLTNQTLRHAAAALWCTLVSQFEIDLEPEQLAELLAVLPPPCGSDFIPSAALFLVYASTRWADQVADKFPFIAAVVFASDDFQLAQIQKDALIALAQAMGQFQTENFIEYVGHHEGRLMRMIANLEALTAGD